jgi:hypothetical protein
VVFHRVSVCDSIRNVHQCVSGFGLTVNAQTEDSVFCQVHVLGLVALLHFWVQDWSEVTFLQKILLVFLRLDQGDVTVGRPGAWKNVQESCCAFEVLVEEMCHNVLVLLRLLN